MTDAQALALSQAFSDLAAAIVKILNDLSLPLSAEQRQTLDEGSDELIEFSEKLAIAGALAALAAAQSDFDAMTQATTSANAALVQLKGQAAKINAILNVLGAAITFGKALTGGAALAAIMTAASGLATAASSA